MTRLHTFALAALVACCAAPRAEAQGDPAGYIRSCYMAYIGRDASPQEIGIWQNAMAYQGMSAQEVHANILGSDDAFNRYNRDPDGFAAAVFQIIHQRQMAPNERHYWLTKWQQVGGDRIKWARELLGGHAGPPHLAGAANFAGQPNFAGGPVGVPPQQFAGVAGGGAELFGQLVAVTQQMIQSAQAELPGQSGQLVVVQASQLLQSAQQLQGVMQNPQGYNVQQIGEVYHRCREGIQAVSFGLGPVGQSAPTTSGYFEKARQLIDQMLGVVPGTQVPPHAQFANAGVPAFQQPQPQFGPVTSFSPQTFTTIDQAIGQADALNAGFQPYVASSPSVPAFQSAIRSQRNNLAQLKHLMSTGAGRNRLVRVIESINADQQRLRYQYQATQQRNRFGGGLPDINGFEAAVRAVNGLMGGF